MGGFSNVSSLDTNSSMMLVFLLLTAYGVVAAFLLKLLGTLFDSRLASKEDSAMNKRYYADQLD